MTRMFGWLACVGAVALLVIAMVTGVAPAAAAVAARVTNAMVRLAVVPGRPAAGYFTLTAGPAAVELTGVTSPLARVDLHGSSVAGGVMRMDVLPAVRVAAGEKVAFAPGGRHLMLSGLPANIRPGGSVPLTFTFADGTVVRVAATVATGTDAMPGMAM